MPRSKEEFQQIRDASRQHILDTAAEVFAAKGLADTRVNDLIEAAGVSHGLLYWYFKDKEAVYIALLDQAVTGVTLFIRNARQREGSSLDKIDWLTAQVLQGITEKPSYIQLISQAIAVPGKVHNSLRQLEAASNTLREIIAEGQKAGEIVNVDPDHLVLQYFALLYGLAAGKNFNIPWVNEHFPSSEAVIRIFKP